MQKHNWKSVSDLCKKSVIEFAPSLFQFLKTTSLAPLNNEFYGQICSAKIKTSDPLKLQRLLFEKYKIEIPIMQHGLDSYIRFSFQAFNTEKEIEYLIQSLYEIQKHTHLIEF